MYFNHNPYPSHPLKWKHIGILFVLIMALVAAGVLIGALTAEAQEKKPVWSLVLVNPDQMAEGGDAHYRFTLRAAKPTTEDWKFILSRIGDFQERGAELRGLQVLPCLEGLCGTVFVKFAGQAN